MQQRRVTRDPGRGPPCPAFATACSKPDSKITIDKAFSTAGVAHVEVLSRIGWQITRGAAGLLIGPRRETDNRRFSDYNLSRAAQPARDYREPTIVPAIQGIRTRARFERPSKVKERK